MIISKTPLRMSFVGGGSDLPTFYKRSEGAVISITINKYIYITVNEKFDSDIRVSYSKTENVKSVAEIQHPIVRETLKKLNIEGAIEITSMADIPARTGLGSSSSFTVGILNALHAYQKEFASPERLAREASELEIEILKEPIGKQDQYAAAYGGLNFIRFHTDGRVSVDPIICREETYRRLKKNILVLYTGVTRSASKILHEQNTNTKLNSGGRFEVIEKMVRFAYDLRAELQKNNLDAFGEILNENWMLKQKLASNISNNLINQWYEIGLKHGALGGKLLGAGGGGFLMFYAPHEKHQQIIYALPALRPIHFEFDYGGSKIIFIHQ